MILTTPRDKSEFTMTNIRFLLQLGLVGVCIVFVLSITPHSAGAEQDDASNSSVEISDSTPRNDGDKSQAAAPSRWSRFLSLLGLSGDKPAAPAQESMITTEIDDKTIVPAKELKNLQKTSVNETPSGTPDSSVWENVLSTVGLNNDKPAAPPLELKSSSAYLGQDYLIGPGDQLGISVWRDEMLTRTVLVLPDGKIQFPLIGEIVVGGKTVGTVKKELVEKLASYIVDADISVEVKQSSSLFIYIIGRVNAPGRQMLVADTSVIQALAMAGGLNPFAQEDDIKIFRQEKDKTLVYKFRYSHVAVGKHLEDNIQLKRGDVLIVP